ncbi:hypothetical protein FH972_023651 [Carpinus fangiana]|uniref:Sucrose transporter n=1 Tax=Carpinus fangiana TaxID=176857 RepID=A0A5N6KW69_9ROSI|nr:hypothetical protein FH972_023651 [Carpinus fangiana]
MSAHNYTYGTISPALPAPTHVPPGTPSSQDSGTTVVSSLTISDKSTMLSSRISDDDLAHTQRVHDNAGSDDDDDRPAEPSKSTLYLILLTISLLGLQTVWCVELAGVTPFLLSLGLSKSLMALVWIAGPLSGTLVQPYVGIKSDDSRMRFGRRRPFIVGGAVATIVSLLALAWTREIMGAVLWLFGAGPEARATVLARQIFAVCLVYILDFAINVIQAAIRAFIVDCAPMQQQEQANAWASRVTGVGNVVGFLAGYVHLPAILPLLGHTQFQVLCALSCITLASTVALSCLTVSERDPRLFGQPSQVSTGVIGFFKDLYHAFSHLPMRVRRVCQVQLFAWVAWFPFLFYISTYIGGLYAEPFFQENPNMTDAEIDAVWERGTRLGAFALLIFAIATLSSSIIIPLLIVPSFDDSSVSFPSNPPAEAPLALTSSPTAISNPPFAATIPRRPASSHSQHSFPTRLLRKLRIPNLTLRRVWLLSHLLFCFLMWLTIFIRSTGPAIALVGIVGIPWAVTNWAPFALIAAEISARDASRRRHPRRRRPSRASLLSSSAAAANDAHDAERGTAIDALDEDDDDDDDARDATAQRASQAGVVLGIHNVSIASPQVLATLGSSAMFWLLQRPRGQPGDGSVGWVLRVGGLCALGAAWFCRYVAEPGSEVEGRGKTRRRGSYVRVRG